MKTLAAFLVVVLACTVCSLAQNPALDAPGEKPITVRSEIVRGSELCRLSVTVDLLKMGSIYFDAYEKERKERRGSDGFRLGWAASYLLSVNGLLMNPKLTEFNSERAVSFGEGTAKSLRAEVTRLSEKFGISDKELAEVMGYGYEKIRPRLEFSKPDGTEGPLMAE